jgi:hypothetical protein
MNAEHLANYFFGFCDGFFPQQRIHTFATRAFKYFMLISGSTVCSRKCVGHGADDELHKPTPVSGHVSFY